MKLRLLAIAFLVFLLICTLVSVQVNAKPPKPTSTPTPRPTSNPTPSPTPTRTPTPSPTPLPTATPTPTPKPTVTPTPTLTPTPTSTPPPTLTPTPTPTTSPTPSPSPSPTSTPIPTPTTTQPPTPSPTEPPTPTLPPTPYPTETPTPTLTPTNTSRLSPIPVATPLPSSTPLPTIVSAETDIGGTVYLAIDGNVTSIQLSNVTISTNRSDDSTIMSFTVTGERDTTGFSNITIPKAAITNGTNPVVYVDGLEALDQGYTQDTNNFYVWYTTHFSTHQVEIQFSSFSRLRVASFEPFLAVVVTVPEIILIYAVIAVRRLRQKPDNA